MAKKQLPSIQNPRKATQDFIFENHGSLCFLRPLSSSAVEWIEENISQTDSFQPYWPVVLIEPRFVSDILSGILREGWSVR
jgi:hypothetical protein